MQFIKNGPDIPEQLLQAHEEGRVVFFCGAGISYNAGLPGFKGLVEQIYSELNATKEPDEADAFEKGQYDATLDLLERRIPGQRIVVRKALTSVLKPNLRRKGAKNTHEALLRLAKDRDGEVRIVTTNFDRIFESFAKRGQPKTKAYQAPLLPIPKKSRWNGIVYLHGLLPTELDESALNCLVLSSGDFGLAYLTERWAARFVSELFRNYVVCFIGYGINDPVLRYMMDALAADRMLGETTPAAYAFGEYVPGQFEKKKIEWQAKGVIPVLYENSANDQNHSVFHQTLKAWAQTYSEGVDGKKRIVGEYAIARPQSSTKQDDFVGRMLWALSDESGAPTKYFADFDPVPPIEWLETFSEIRFKHSDLSRFGVAPSITPDEKLSFSLVSRPASYLHSQRMRLASGGFLDAIHDETMRNLARWLRRHLDEPRLILWLARQGGKLHENLVWVIQNRIDEIVRLELAGKTEELEVLRKNSPNGIPRKEMRVLWDIFLAGRAKSHWYSRDLHEWGNRLTPDGLSNTHLLELRSILEPQIKLREPIRWPKDTMRLETTKRFKDLVAWDIELACNHVFSGVKEFENTAAWKSALPKLFDTFQQLLLDALRLMQDMGDVDDLHDRSYLHMPSISAHPQNTGFTDWVVLIHLLRDSWESILKSDANRAARIVHDWISQPYPTFKRLAFYAVTRNGIVLNGDWVDWLAADSGRWLWSPETRRELLRLLVLRGASLPEDLRLRLETAITHGPPQKKTPEGFKDEEWKEITDHSVWLRLAKLVQGGCVLDKDAKQHFDNLTSMHSNWKLASDERDEFSTWHSSSSDSDYEEFWPKEKAPLRRRALVDWLKLEPKREDNWNELCVKSFPLAATALIQLSQEDGWPSERWETALYAWQEEKLLRRSWRCLAPILNKIPDEFLKQISHSVSFWLESASKLNLGHEAILISLCSRLLDMPHKNSSGLDVQTEAINHPVGHVTEALVRSWFNRKPEDNQGLPAEFKTIFTKLCDTKAEQFIYARVILAANTISLFRVDRDWATINLIPLLNWTSSPKEACTAWASFLWSPRWHAPLFATIKNDFLETARHYCELDKSGDQYVNLLIYIALNHPNEFSIQEFTKAVGALPQSGLEASSRMLAQFLEGAGDQSEEYWKNHIYPFWKKIWPKSNSLISKSIAESLARLAIAARGQFAEALEAVQAWLIPVEHPYYIVHLLRESGLCSKSPRESLILLVLIGADEGWTTDELKACLSDISGAWPEAVSDANYKRLNAFIQSR